ncbi:MAG: hypothetical protein LBS69_01820 [Prevotellaceae bacterium]|jgi:hypothetical protein|nr:hypothetical protein [Prevotellaceae bacterium]
MNKIVITFILIAYAITVSAQTEIQPLPDTSKFLFDAKPTLPINNNFNSLKNPFPAKLTINHNDIFLSIKDTVKQDSLSVLHKQKTNPDLLFVRSAYFTGKSPLFVEINKRHEIKSGVAIPFFISSEKLHSLSYVRLRFVGNSWQWKAVSAQLDGAGGIGIGIGISSKEERMKKIAEKRKKAYVY